MTHFPPKMTHNRFPNIVPILSQFAHPGDDGRDLDEDYHRGLSPGSQSRPIQVQITRPEYSRME
jgi:hypothetical protein